MSSCVAEHPAWNVAVIGAGPAGSVAAIRLAQLGHQVMLFEKAKFPRDKVCGECLSATGIAVLDRLGVAEALRAELKPTMLCRASAVAMGGSQSVVDLPATMWGLTRSSMDAFLAENAIEANIDICFGTEASPFDRGTGFQPVTSVLIEVKSRVENPCHIEVNAVILADGRGNSISRVPPTSDFGIKAHFRDVDAERDTIELVALVDGGYAGLAPVNGDLWNAAWSVPGTLLKKHRGNIDALFGEALARSPHLRRRFARATRVGDWLSCPLPRHAVRKDWPRNVIPIGNAAAALEPVGGEGMGLAMRSGELAAKAIDAAAREGRDIDAAMLRKSFDRLWRTRSAACRGAAVALSHPIAGPIAIEVSRRLPALARAGLALVGK
jgi:menaquinone-9 beta-reductase